MRHRLVSDIVDAHAGFDAGSSRQTLAAAPRTGPPRTAPAPAAARGVLPPLSPLTPPPRGRVSLGDRVAPVGWTRERAASSPVDTAARRTRPTASEEDVSIEVANESGVAVDESALASVARRVLAAMRVNCRRARHGRHHRG